jgi:23S rRNA (pseudouridine1915-N3)-methyltransferase
MQLIAVGKLRAGPERELFDKYNARLRPKLAVTEIAEARGSPAEVKRRETEALLAALPEKALAVMLDLGGSLIDSHGLAGRVRQWLETPRPLVFVVGGAEGLGQAALERADVVLSLGALTWPHLLVRGLLTEQLYRAQSINAGHPYHRGGRPI